MSSLELHRFSVRTTSALLLFAACSGGGSSTEPDPQPNPTAALVTIDPRGLTLPVGGRGQLTASVRDAAGNPMSGVAVTWSSRNPPIASVNAGTVDGNAVGVTQVIASAGSRADTVAVIVVDGFTLEVTPPAASARVGQSVQFTAIARNSAGDVIPTPPVTWSSSSPGTASISNNGLALGARPGTTNITATAGRVTSTPAVLQVIDSNPAGPCDGITNVTAFEGQIEYGFKAVRVRTESGAEISADDNGTLKATMTLRSTGPFLALWHGDITGNASVTQEMRFGDDITTLRGGGSMVPVPGLGHPQMSLIVNLQTCRYRLIAVAAISATLTERGVAQTSNQQVTQMQFENILGAWRLGWLRENDSLPAHSIIWGALNLNKDTLMPLGLAVHLFQGSGDEPFVGLASAGYTLLAK